MGTYKACLPIMLRGTTRHNTNRHDRGLRCAINLLCEMTTFWMKRQFRVISLHGATPRSFHAAINSARAATVQHFCNTPKNETFYSLHRPTISRHSTWPHTSPKTNYAAQRYSRKSLVFMPVDTPLCQGYPEELPPDIESTCAIRCRCDVAAPW